MNVMRERQATNAELLLGKRSCPSRLPERRDLSRTWDRSWWDCIRVGLPQPCALRVFLNDRFSDVSQDRAVVERIQFINM